MKHDLGAIYQAVHYWHDDGAAERPQLTDRFVLLQVNGHPVAVSTATLRRGVQRLAAMAAQDAIDDTRDRDARTTTPWGVALAVRHPGKHLDDLRDGDADALDVACQVGLFRGLIFG